MAVLLLAKKTRLGRYLPMPNLRFWAQPGAGDATGDGVNGDGASHAPEVQNNSAAEPRQAPPALAALPVVETVEYAIAHRITGRIRLQIPRLAQDAPFARRLEEQIAALPAVTQVRVNRKVCSLIVHYAAKSPDGAAITGDLILPQIVDALRVAAGARRATLHTEHGNSLAFGESDLFKKLGLPVLGIGLSAGAAAGLALPGVVVGGAILAASTPIFKRSWQGIRDEKRLTVDFLDATVVTLMTMQASFLAPACMVGIIEGAEVLRDWTARRQQEAAGALLESHPEQVTVERNGQAVTVSSAEVAVGDVVLVYPGDAVAVDGPVLEGHAWIDQRQVLGHADLVAYQVGDEALAGGIVVDGYLRIRAARIGAETLAARMITLVEHAPEVDTRSSNHARRVGNKFVYPTLAVGGAVWAASGSVARMTGILSLDVGTGMRVSAPIAILSAQTYAARQGILIRSGRAVEALAKVDIVIFDKTATLTQGQAAVVDVQTIHARISPAEVLGLAASAEQHLSHPLATAIVRQAHAIGVPLLPCQNWRYLSGEGVEAEIDGQLIHVGNARLMERIDLDAGAVKFRYPAALADTASRAYVAWNQRLVGVLLITDPLRAESAAVIATLAGMQVTPHLLSGDRAASALATAALAGIPSAHVAADLAAAQKLEFVQRLQAGGSTVAMVGDGLNDAAALAHADVSLALGSATGLARHTADVVLLNDDLNDLVEAIRIARRGMQMIRQNEALVIGANLSAIAYGMLLPLGPIAGVVINNGTAFVAAANSLRPLLGAATHRQGSI